MVLFVYLIWGTLLSYLVYIVDYCYCTSNSYYFQLVTHTSYRDQICVNLPRQNECCLRLHQSCKMFLFVCLVILGSSRLPCGQTSAIDFPHYAWSISCVTITCIYFTLASYFVAPSPPSWQTQVWSTPLGSIAPGLALALLALLQIDSMFLPRCQR